MNKLHYSLRNEEVSVETIQEVVNQLKEDGLSVDSVQTAFVRSYTNDEVDQHTRMGYMTLFTKDSIDVEYFMDTMNEKTSLDMSGTFQFLDDEDELIWRES